MNQMDDAKSKTEFWGHFGKWIIWGLLAAAIGTGALLFAGQQANQPPPRTVPSP